MLKYGKTSKKKTQHFFNKKVSITIYSCEVTIISSTKNICCRGSNDVKYYSGWSNLSSPTFYLRKHILSTGIFVSTVLSAINCPQKNVRVKSYKLGYQFAVFFRKTFDGRCNLWVQLTVDWYYLIFIVSKNVRANYSSPSYSEQFSYFLDMT